MKKTLSLVLSLIMIATTLSCLPFTALADPTSGTDGDIAWSYSVIDGFPTLTIKGSGAGQMNDYTENTVPWKSYRNTVTDVEIRGVKHLGNYAFYNFSELRCVEIKGGVDSVGANAFCNCAKLNSVDPFGKNCGSLGAYSFYNCPELDSVTIQSTEISLLIHCLGVKDNGNGGIALSNEDFTITYPCNNNDVEIYISNHNNMLSADIKSDLTHSYNHSTYKVVTKSTFNSSGRIQYNCRYCDAFEQDFVHPLKSATLAKTTYTCSGTAFKPAVTVKDMSNTVLKNGTDYTVAYTNNKNVGTATATVTFKGKYGGTKKLAFKINPKGTKITEITPRKKGLLIKWKKQAVQTTGYQVQVSTSSKFTKKATKTYTIKNNKTCKKGISKLKGNKKYFVRIRTYKKVNGKNYYSAWSKTSKKTKK